MDSNVDNMNFSYIGIEVKKTKDALWSKMRLCNLKKINMIVSLIIVSP